MIIIPAIDLKDGRVVRLIRGDFNEITYYSDNPAEVSMKWGVQGAKLLHVVDLDGALTGSSKNIFTIEHIIQSVNIPIQVGGGLRTEASVERVLTLGASRAVIGTRAIFDQEFLQRLLQKFGEKIIVSIDARGDNVVTKGWTSRTTMDSIDCTRWMELLGVKTIIYTNILRDGTMERPQLNLIEDIVDSVNIDVIVAGGISSLQDIKDIKSLGRPNLSGVIVGRALYENRFTLTDANKIVESE